MLNIAVIMCYCGRNERWLYNAICSLKSKHKVDIYVHLDGCQRPVSFVLDSMATVIQSLPKVGYANGINKCVLEIMRSGIKYDYIARMDDDDICTDDRLDKQVEFLESHNEIDFCGTLLCTIDTNDKVINECETHQKWNGKEWVDRFLEGGCHIANGTCMFKGKMLYEGHIWYNPLYIVIEDYELWFRLFRQGYKYAVVEEPLYKYRVHPGQETQNGNMFHKRMSVATEIHRFYKSNWENFLLK